MESGTDRGQSIGTLRNRTRSLHAVATQNSHHRQHDEQHLHLTNAIPSDDRHGMTHDLSHKREVNPPSPSSSERGVSKLRPHFNLLPRHRRQLPDASTARSTHARCCSARLSLSLTLMHHASWNSGRRRRRRPKLHEPNEQSQLTDPTQTLPPSRTPALLEHQETRKESES